jgi:RNA polymerase sigma-70 factor (ECF subfamily)
MPKMSKNSAAKIYDEASIVERIARGDQQAFELMMRRHNGRLFRVARSILKDDAAAEDALQDGYLDAFQRIRSFRGDASLSTWLTRIVINRSLMHLRRDRRDRVVVPFGEGPHSDSGAPEDAMPDRGAESPPDATMRAEVRQMLERRIDELPVAFRTVFVMREVEDMSVDEVAECLGIPPATVRTRLFRARALLREALSRDMDTATPDVFGFAGERCNRIVAAVLARAGAKP